MLRLLWILFGPFTIQHVNKEKRQCLYFQMHCGHDARAPIGPSFVKLAFRGPYEATLKQLWSNMRLFCRQRCLIWNVGQEVFPTPVHKQVARFSQNKMFLQVSLIFLCGVISRTILSCQYLTNVFSYKHHIQTVVPVIFLPITQFCSVARSQVRFFFLSTFFLVDLMNDSQPLLPIISPPICLLTFHYIPDFQPNAFCLHTNPLAIFSWAPFHFCVFNSLPTAYWYNTQSSCCWSRHEYFISSHIQTNLPLFSQ